MDQRRQQEVEEVFLAAADLRERGGDEGAIAALIAERCRGDEALRAEVESLLGAQAAEGVLDRADVVLAATGAGTPGGAGRSVRPPWEEPALPPGTVLGGYTLERVLGEGGMGVVYVARQERPRRTVALKVIRPALTNPAMLRRFEMEAEILGRLQHPGIAQIYEAGIADGRPYLAMELVNGRTLVEHAEHYGLGTRERLELVARVCDAVQHAHQKGVIHRDLKPSNILVDPSAPGPPDGHCVALASADPTLRVLDAATLATLFEIEGERQSWACAFSADGGTLAVAMPSNEIHLFDTRTWKRFATLEGHSKVILSVAFAPDGHLLASCGLDGSVRLWDPTRRRNEHADGSSITGRNLATIWSGPMEVSRVVFSADGRTLLTGGADRRLIAWDLCHYDRHIAGNLDVHLRRAVDRGEVSAGRAAATRARVLRHLRYDTQGLPRLTPDP